MKKMRGAIGEFNDLLGAGAAVASRDRKRKGRHALVATMRGSYHDPAVALGEKLTEALDASKAPSPVKRFSAEEIDRLNRERTERKS